MKKLIWLSALTGFIHGWAQSAESAGSLGPVSMGSYRQTVLVTFKSEAAARQASLHLAPLYHDLRAAFSTRMDDSNLNSLRVAEVMAQNGQKGTFTLNDPRNWWQDSYATGITAPANPAVEILRRLQANGSSIGGHTLTHEMLPALSKNSAFREIMGVRVALETNAASPNVVFVYPFVFYRSVFRDGVDRADLDEMLRRSGYYQLAEHKYNEDWDSQMQDGLFMVLDGSTYDGRYNESILTQPRCEEDRPLFLVTMHAWVKEWGGPDFPKLAEIYRKWSGRPDWWYCNNNQYGAYRYQALHSRMTAFVEGKVVRAVLTRPDPLDLGDWTPLTLRVDGVSKEEVVSVESGGAEVQPVALKGAYAFDLFHARQRGTIEAYAETNNPKNSERLEEAPVGAEGLRARLYRKGRVLTLVLRNEGAQALQDIRAVFRLPLRWEEGAVRKPVGSLASGASVTLEIPLTERADPEHYSDGPEYDVAQVDYRGERRVRLYATCEVAGDEPAAFFARNGFWVLGPLAGDVAGFDPQVFAQSFLEGGAPAKEYTVPWGRSLAWKNVDPAKALILDPDIIPTTGKPNIPANYKSDPALHFPHTQVHFVLYGRIVSPDNRTVRAVFPRDAVKWISLNGQKVAGAELSLKKGANDLRMLYLPSTATVSSFEENNYGCYFRLTDAEGNRVEDVRFERPSAP